MVLRQLEKPEAHASFETIIIDTISIAWDLCEQYICAQNSVQKISDIEWGGGYTACKKEFESTLRKITQLGYGVVLIAHNATRIEKTADGSEVEIISPELPKRAAEICNGIVDIIGYIGNEYKDGENHRWLYTRETPTLFAGSRFKYLAPKIKFGYQELVDAIGDAIEKAEQLDGAVVVDKQRIIDRIVAFEERMRRSKPLEQEVGAIDPPRQALENPIKKVERNYFQQTMRLSEINEDQCDLYELVVLMQKEML